MNQPQSQDIRAGRILLAYFSRAGVNYYNGSAGDASSCRGATIGERLAVRGEEVDDAEPAVVEWLQGVGLVRP
ncbi:hypothetical protein FXW78_14705 [Rhodococcus opacus]|nr:hypothetical protein [Rhodococcus opacus]